MGLKKMKKILLSIIIVSLLLMLLIGVIAPPIPPYVIAGKVSLQDGSCVKDFNIKARTFSFSEFQYKEIEIPVDENCEYALVLGNAPFDNWNEGLKVDLTFCDLSKNSACLQSLIIGQGNCEAGGGCRLDFTYKSIDYTVAGEPITKYVNKYVCWDGSSVTDVSQCPVQPAKIKCADGTLVDKQEECLETNKQVNDYLIGAGVVAAAGFGYLVSYFVRKGKRTRARKMVDTYIRKRRK